MGIVLRTGCRHESKATPGWKPGDGKVIQHVGLWNILKTNSSYIWNVHFLREEWKRFYLISWRNILLNLKQFVFLHGILHDTCIIRKIRKDQSDRLSGCIPNLFLLYSFSRDILNLKMSLSKKENYLNWWLCSCVYLVTLTSGLP